MYRIIKFNQKGWLKPYIDVNTYIFKLLNIAVLQKNIENENSNSNKKTKAKTEARKNYLVSEPCHHTTTYFSENLLAIEIKAIQIFIIKPVYFGLSIL